MLQEWIKQYNDRVRTISIDVLVNDLNGNYQFPDDSILRSKQILGIMANAPSDLFFGDIAGAAATSRDSPISQLPLAGIDAFVNAYITLKRGNTAIMDTYPLTDISTYSTSRILRPLVLSHFNPSKSYVIVPNPATANRLTVNTVFSFNFYYLDDE